MPPCERDAGASGADAASAAKRTVSRFAVADVAFSFPVAFVDCSSEPSGGSCDTLNC